METMELKVPGMTCGHCVAAVKEELVKLDGVASVDVDLATKVVLVTGDELSWPAITAAVDEAGYEAVR
ncbi:MAG: heavy-metal-associated domain-containing protein [Ilumatobacteraceae bacterium]